MALPAWLAAIVQVPASRSVTVEPKTVHTVGVSELNATAKPELAVADTVAVPPTVSVGAAPNVIVWLPGPTVMVWVTCGAALKLALPAWLAATTHEPAVTPVTVLPATVQTPVVVELKVTGNPELAVALKAPLVPTVSVGAAPNVMVWGVTVAVTVMLCVACGAAL